MTLAKVVWDDATGINVMFNAVREPYAGKLACTVLRGPHFREGARLPTNLPTETDSDFFNSNVWKLPLRSCLVQRPERVEQCTPAADADWHSI